MNSPWIAQLNRLTADGVFTDTEARCLWAVPTFRGRGGEIYPSHETIAARAKRSVSTLQRALNKARAAGIIRWTERRVRVGWRWLRTSNCYELLTTGQSDRGSLKARSYLLSSAARAASRGAKEAQGRHAEELRVLLEAAAGLPDLLKARREAHQRQYSPPW